MKISAMLPVPIREKKKLGITFPRDLIATLPSAITGEAESLHDEATAPPDRCHYSEVRSLEHTVDRSDV